METIPALLEDYNLTTRAYAEVLFHYFGVQKYSVFHKWYECLREVVGPAQIREFLLGIIDKPQFIDRLIKGGEGRRRLSA